MQEVSVHGQSVCLQALSMPCRVAWATRHHAHSHRDRGPHELQERVDQPGQHEGCHHRHGVPAALTPALFPVCHDATDQQCMQRHAAGLWTNSAWRRASLQVPLDRSDAAWTGIACSAANLSTWHGVSCSNGRVTVLNVTALRLAGHSRAGRLIIMMIPDSSGWALLPGGPADHPRHAHVKTGKCVGHLFSLRQILC